MARTNTAADHRLREEFFAEGKRLDAQGDPAANCWICSQRVDYQVAPNTTPDSHNLDHFKPVRNYPELQGDPSNARHSHAACNKSRGAKAPSPGLGEAVPDWW
ncbi:MAG: 55, gp55 [Subtercola sp.]|nr:55, gp55 [Subtercola sp.]